MKQGGNEKPKMEKKKSQGKRQISIFTVLIWLMLIAVMLVITITGISKDNALENSRKVTVKIDFSTMISDQGITDSAEIEANLENTTEIFRGFKSNNITSKSDMIEVAARYIGSEEKTIGIYELDITEEVKYIGMMVPTNGLLEYEIVNETEIPELIYFFPEGAIYGEKLDDNVDEYHLTFAKKEAVKVKLDVSKINNFDINSFKLALFSNDCIVSASKVVEKTDNFVILNIYPNSGIDFDMVFAGDYHVLEDDQNLDKKEILGESYYYKNINIDDIQSEYSFKLKKDSTQIKIKVSGLENSIADSLYENLKVCTSAWTGDLRDLLNSTSSEGFEYCGKDNDGNYIYELEKKSIENYIGFLQENIEVDGCSFILKENSDDYYISKEMPGNVVMLRIDKKNGIMDEIYMEIEYKESSNIKVNINVEGTDDEELISEIYSYYKIQLANFEANNDITNLEKEGVSQTTFIGDIFPNCHYGINTVFVTSYDNNSLILYEVNGKKVYQNSQGNGGRKIEFISANSKETLEINITIIMNIDRATFATKSLEWINQENGTAKISLGYTSMGITWYDSGPVSINIFNGKGIYKDTLSEEFLLSSEYESDSKWSIIDSASSNEIKGIPENVYREFYLVDEDNYTGKEYVYVKDTNTIYWCFNKIEYRPKDIQINVIYKNYDQLTNGIIVQSNKDATLNYISEEYDNTLKNTVDVYEKYNISSPNLKFEHLAEAVLVINKEVKGETGNNVYYVGLFENESENKANKIYKINSIDGKGSVSIDIDNPKKVYYLYEVDENGNKISNEKINYSKNKIEFSNYVRKAEITTDSTIVSSVMSERFDKSKMQNRLFETDINNTEGTGEKDYVNNMLSVRDVYQEEILISSEEVKYKVIYMPEEGGKIEGKTEEFVNPEDTPQNVPLPKPDKGYQFIRWEVEENGERVEVNPNEYVITKDTIFYAIFEKVSIDTSDINIIAYVIISLVAIVGVVVGIIIVKNSKK